jgi:hypothetical protein
MLMAYAVGRRVEPFDMPTIRAIVRSAAAERLPHVRFDFGRREERGVPHGTS